LEEFIFRNKGEPCCVLRQNESHILRVKGKRSQFWDEKKKLNNVLRCYIHIILIFYDMANLVQSFKNFHISSL
jgi:hypothetical protein